jgi:signal peptidase I
VAEPATSRAGGATSRPGGDGSHRRRRGGGWLEWVVILAAAVIVAVLLHVFLVQAYYIPSGSMEPTLKVGDRVLVNKLSYDLHSVHRGDIIVFKKPPGESLPGITDLIKRVIGLPGERISSAPDGAVLVNGKPIAQPWLTPQARQHPGIPITAQTIPPGDYFVMGDNRDNSEDSRYIGPIPGSDIIGRAFFRVWPLSSLGTL